MFMLIIYLEKIVWSRTSCADRDYLVTFEGSCCFQGSCSRAWSAKSDDLHISEDTGSDEESSNPANKEPEV
ncbi:hypothetical protein LIER_26617 [Lithospermum erythrorhizon]|uniref:Uncharacterized protein n=1 Tax=Lithospermum erythrorhizon TaxID=34254 RepID=A0AAV3RA99_LITER